ncbi:MAG: hypothetical protein KR126chlam1_01145 [Chlamydiae bacterium]|nr:hypothetical protein [Chlamydiota bacterium]
MKKLKILRPFFLLALFVLSLLSVPQSGVEKIRSFVISGISPCWSGLDHIKCASLSFFSASQAEENREAIQLRAENLRLKQQIERLKGWLSSEKEIEREWQQMIALTRKGEEDFFARRSRHLSSIIEKQLGALPARVVFREPALWSSTIWLDVGAGDNRALGREIVAKNSPVILGKAVVGVVEEVNEKRCRVRLITDQLLSPSVRAVRGGERDLLLCERVDALLELLSFRDDLEGASLLAEALSAFQSRLEPSDRSLFLAKGQLHGGSAPLWRANGQTLTGIGFNYDFVDEEGKARSLRTGASTVGGAGAALIQTGDLLVTTGMDGIFPPDLHVGIVTKILPLHEGGVAYQLKAQPLVSNLSTLTDVMVLPPLF